MSDKTPTIRPGGNGAKKPPPGTDLEIYDFGDDSGAGLEGARSEELLTPFLAVLQSNSPQLDSGSPLYQESARAGMLINTMSGQLFDGKAGVDLVPVARDYQYTLWRPRDLNGGFRGTVAVDDPQIAKLLQRYGHFRMPRYRDGAWTGDPFVTQDEEEVEAVEQFNLFAMVGTPPIAADTAERVVVAFTSTKIAAYKALFTRVSALKYPVGGRMITPPIWAHRWRLTTVRQENSKGVFFNVRFDLDGASPRDALIRPNEPLYLLAKEFSEMVRSGQAKANYDAGAGAAEDGAAGGQSGAAGAGDVPF